MTTWHANQPLRKALYFFVYCAFPTQAYERECKHRIVLSIANDDWAAKSVRYMKAVVASARTGRAIDEVNEEKKA